MWMRITSAPGQRVQLSCRKLKTDRLGGDTEPKTLKDIAGSFSSETEDNDAQARANRRWLEHAAEDGG